MQSSYSLNGYGNVPEAAIFDYVSSSSLSAGKILCVVPNANNLSAIPVAYADSSASSTSTGTLFYSLTGSIYDSTRPMNSTGKMTKMFRLTAVDTSAASAGAYVYLGTSGAYSFSPGTRKRVIGRVEVSSATAGSILFDLEASYEAPVEFSIADGTAVTNTTTETALGSRTFNANTLTTGVFRLRYAGITTGQNGTDTLKIKATLGPTGSATTIFESTAVDQDVNDIYSGDIMFTVRAAPAASVTIAAAGFASDPDAAPTMKAVSKTATFDTTVANVLSVTATWSVAHASNSTKLTSFVVEHIA